MNNKKTIVFGILAAMLMVTMLSIVSAVGSGPGGSNTFGDKVTNFIEGVKDAGAPIFGLLFGETVTGEDLVIKILAFFLTLLIVYGVLGAVNLFEDKSWINLAIGFIIAVIGVRFLPKDFLQAFTEPSSAFVAVLLFAIPFVALFYFTKKFKNSYARRAVWAAYGAIILVLWWYNNNKYSWVYLAIFAACLIAFWFDATLQKWNNRAGVERATEHGADLARAELINRINTQQMKLAKAPAAARAAIKTEITELKTNLKALG